MAKVDDRHPRGIAARASSARLTGVCPAATSHEAGQLGFSAPAAGPPLPAARLAFPGGVSTVFAALAVDLVLASRRRPPLRAGRPAGRRLGSAKPSRLSSSSVHPIRWAATNSLPYSRSISATTSCASFSRFFVDARLVMTVMRSSKSARAVCSIAATSSGAVPVVSMRVSVEPDTVQPEETPGRDGAVAGRLAVPARGAMRLSPALHRQR